MFKLVSVSSGKVLAQGIHTEREAKILAGAEAAQMLSRTPNGRRMLGWYNGKITWDVAKMHVMVEEMVGDWIAIQQPEDVPDETTDDFEVVFIVKRKCQKFIGCYDAEEGEFVAQGDDGNQRFAAERVIAYMLLPDTEQEGCP